MLEQEHRFIKTEAQLHNELLCVSSCGEELGQG